jgi:hypothetical protein
MSTTKRDEAIRRFTEVVKAQRWTFAKSMPTIPHEYTLRQRWVNGPDGMSFDHAVLAIRIHGYQEMWRGRRFTYLDIDGWKYWTMGSPVPETRVINRARIVKDPNADLFE